MHVGVLGGTAFIGRAIVDDLLGAGHDVTVFHRGVHEPDDLSAAVAHVHVARADLATERRAVEALDAFVDTSCISGEGARQAIDVAGGLRLLVLSSMDVYRAYDGMRHSHYTDPVPLTEDSPLRPDRYPYRGQVPGMDDYEKQDVEEAYLARGGTVCRLPIVYGERDYQRREWGLLRRVVAGRKKVPVGAANVLISRGYVGDVARGVRMALESDAAVGEVFNLCEASCATPWAWYRQILDAAGAPDVELVTVPDDVVPADLGLTTGGPQHLLVSAAKADRVLGWQHGPVVDGVRASVTWHLAHPPDAPEGDDDADPWVNDDQALARAQPAEASE